MWFTDIWIKFLGETEVITILVNQVWYKKSPAHLALQITLYIGSDFSTSIRFHFLDAGVFNLVYTADDKFWYKKWLSMLVIINSAW